MRSLLYRVWPSRFSSQMPSLAVSTMVRKRASLLARATSARSRAPLSTAMSVATSTNMSRMGRSYALSRRRSTAGNASILMARTERPVLTRPGPKPPYQELSATAAKNGATAMWSNQGWKTTTSARASPVKATAPP